MNTSSKGLRPSTSAKSGRRPLHRPLRCNPQHSRTSYHPAPRAQVNTLVRSEQATPSIVLMDSERLPNLLSHARSELCQVVLEILPFALAQTHEYAKALQD